MTATTDGSASGAEPALRHSVRNSLVDSERGYALEPDRLSWSEKKGHGSVAYAEIASVQLIGYAGSGGGQYQATIRRGNGKPIKIRSHHYVSLGNFEDRGESYAPFIRELCRRIAASAPKARFLSGSTYLWIIWLVVALLMALVAILAVSAAYLPGAPALPAFLVLLAGAPLIWREARKGPKTTFDPKDPPPELLGGN